MFESLKNPKNAVKKTALNTLAQPKVSQAIDMLSSLGRYIMLCETKAKGLLIRIDFWKNLTLG